MPRGANLVDGRTEGRRDGGTDGRTGHFGLPDLPEHTTTRDAFGPKIRNLIKQYSTHFTWTFVITTVCGCVHVRDIYIITDLPHEP